MEKNYCRTYVVKYKKKNGETVEKTYVYTHKRSFKESKVLVSKHGDIKVDNIRNFKMSFTKAERKAVMEILVPFIRNRQKITADEIRMLYENSKKENK